MNKEFWKRTGVSVCVFVTAAVFYGHAAGLFPADFYTGPSGDVWFESDTPRVYDNLTSRLSDHHRAKVHPLFALTSYPPVFMLRKVFSLTGPQAVRVFVALCGGVWAVLLFAVTRIITGRSFDAVLVTMLGAVSAGAVFWHTVPETYALSSVTIMLAFWLVLRAGQGEVPARLYAAVSAATFSITVTNWTAGLIATRLGHGWKKTALISAQALAAVVGLWFIQKLIFPSALFFVRDLQESSHFLLKESGGPPAILTTIFFHSMVMPEIIAEHTAAAARWPFLSVQLSGAGSGGATSFPAVVVWCALLGTGFGSLIALKEHRRLRVLVGAFLLCQTVLHLIYGEETFLYALNFVPVFVMMVALALRTKYRTYLIPCLCLAVVITGINNLEKFLTAVGYLY